MTFNEWCKRWNEYLDGPPEDAEMYMSEPALAQLWKDKEAELNQLRASLAAACQVIRVLTVGHPHQCMCKKCVFLEDIASKESSKGDG